MRDGLTLFVVFKNGKDILERCLSSARLAVDEIIAVDTGATDGAREVAESFDSTVYEMEWPDAFDEAYNYAISKVKTEWTLWLDSDEWLLPQSTFLLQEAMYNPSLEKAFVLNLIRQDLWDDAGNYSEMYQTRMWRTHPAMRLQGVIHAQFTERSFQRAAQGRVMLDTQIRFRHDGFKGGVTKEKLVRNLPYLLRELELRPGQLYFEICVAETYVLIEDPRGIPMVKDLIRRILDHPNPSELPRQCVLIFGLYVEHVVPLEHDEELMGRVADAVLKHFPTNIPILWTMHQYYAAKGNNALAYNFLRKLDHVHRSGLGDKFASYRPSIVQEGLWINMGRFAEEFGEIQVAAYCYKSILQKYANLRESSEYNYALDRLRSLGVA